MEKTHKVKKGSAAKKVDKSTLQPHSRRRSILWNGLNKGTAWLYAVLIESFLGKILTGYRNMDAKLAQGHRYPRNHGCAPVSPTRLWLMNTLDQSALLRFIRFGCRSFLERSTACYGLFGLLYGVIGIILYFVMPFALDSYRPSLMYLVVAIGFTVLSIPLVACVKPLSHMLGSSRIGHLILIRFLGVSRDRLEASCPKTSTWAYLIACLLGVLAAAGSFFIHPLVIPLVLVAICFVGLILAYPEAGVILSTVALPLIWLDQYMLMWSVLCILLTWVSYGIKLLLLHRSIRFDLLDRVMLILGGMMLAFSFIGVSVTTETVWQGVCLVICLSDYFLIVNLMNTRAHIRRCLVGVGLSVVVVTLLSYLRNLPTDGLAWLEGSRAGNAIVEGFSNGMDRLSGLWTEHSEIYLVLVFSWLYAYMLHTKRPIRKIMGGIFILLDFALVLMSGSITALFCVLGITVLFLLMLGHKSLSACLIAALPMGCGIYWLGYLYPVSDALRTILSRSRLYKAQLWDSQWAMVLDYPGGIGVGEASFAAVYPAYAAPDLGAVTGENNLLFEILLSYGWIGLLLMSAVLFLFVQKGLTCLRHTVVPSERAMILGGVPGLIGMVIFGTMRSFITSPRVFFTLLLVVALCSAYENVIFNESDIRAVEWAGSEQAEDRFYRSGDFKK